MSTVREPDLEPSSIHAGWSEDDYLGLETNRRVEFTRGFVEVLPMPTVLHQGIVAVLFTALQAFVSARGLGEALFAGVRVRLSDGTYREPDVVFMAAQHAGRIGELFWEGADLVMEVVSPDRPERDLVRKREEYAQAGIPEYWIVDPRNGLVTVLALEGPAYAVHGTFSAGATATSRLLEGFAVEVSRIVAPRIP